MPASGGAQSGRSKVMPCGAGVGEAEARVVGRAALEQDERRVGALGAGQRLADQRAADALPLVRGGDRERRQGEYVVAGAVGVDQGRVADHRVPDHGSVEAGHELQLGDVLRGLTDQPRQVAPPRAAGRTRRATTAATASWSSGRTCSICSTVRASTDDLCCAGVSQCRRLATDRRAVQHIRKERSMATSTTSTGTSGAGDLAGRLTGRVLTAGDDGYDAARVVMLGGTDPHPGRHRAAGRRRRRGGGRGLRAGDRARRWRCAAAGTAARRTAPSTTASCSTCAT